MVHAFVWLISSPSLKSELIVEDLPTPVSPRRAIRGRLRGLLLDLLLDRLQCLGGHALLGELSRNFLNSEETTKFL